MSADLSILQAALIGYQHQRDQIDAKVAEIRRELGGKTAAGGRWQRRPQLGRLERQSSASSARPEEDAWLRLNGSGGRSSGRRRQRQSRADKMEWHQQPLRWIGTPAPPSESKIQPLC